MSDVVVLFVVQAVCLKYALVGRVKLNELVASSYSSAASTTATASTTASIHLPTTRLAFVEEFIDGLVALRLLILFRPDASPAEDGAAAIVLTERPEASWRQHQ